MFPDLEYADRPEAAGRWSRGKVALLLGGMVAGMVASVAFIVFYDSQEEPWEDLKPPAAATPAPGPEENGYSFLRKGGGLSSYVSVWDYQDAGRVVGGRWAWDDALAVTVLKGNENLRGQLRTALKMPHWQLESRTAATDWLLYAVNALLLEGMGASRSGDTSQELDLLVDMQRLSLRVMAADARWDPAMQIRQQIAARCCSLLSSGKLDAAGFARMDALWENEALTRERLMARFLNEVSSMRKDIQAEDGEVDYYLCRGPRPEIKRRLFKRNRTLNHYHAAARRMLKGLAALPENLDGAVADEGLRPMGVLEEDGMRELFQPGVGVERIGLERLAKVRNGFAPMSLLVTRAMRVRLALYRWQQDHAGALPAKLAELVPEYLPSIPADPWSGQALLWDGGKEGVLYSVGTDWSADVPSFLSGMWMDHHWTSPGLRLNPPPPAPRPAKLTPKSKKGAPTPKRARPPAPPSLPAATATSARGDAVGAPSAPNPAANSAVSGTDPENPAK